MYFPFLRGRQFELIGLRELVDMDLISDKIIPIIEPVKLSSTLISTIETFIKKKKYICIIINPSVGTFIKNCKNIKEGTKEYTCKEKFDSLFKNEYVIKSLYMKDNANKIIERWVAKGYKKNDWMIVNNNRACLPLYEEFFSNTPPKFTLIPDKKSFRKVVEVNSVMFEDKFEKQARNKDYDNIDNEFFSEDHLVYSEDNFIGFSDYSIVGEEYIEAGFAPMAVAIHMVYFNTDMSLWIKHFVSDSNEDISDPAGKFYEAVSKLYDWYHSNTVELTYGLKTFLDHYKNQTYPGLGSVKKLSIMHHIELMSKYLSGKGI